MVISLPASKGEAGLFADHATTWLCLVLAKRMVNDCPFWHWQLPVSMGPTLNPAPQAVLLPAGRKFERASTWVYWWYWQVRMDPKTSTHCLWHTTGALSFTLVPLFLPWGAMLTKNINRRHMGLGALFGHLIARQEKVKFKCLLGMKRLGK